MSNRAWMCGVLLGALAAPVDAQTSWTHSSGQGSWQGRDVALGNRGTQVFAELGPAYPSVLLSGFDQDPPAPVWETPAIVAFHHEVASAEERDLHVSLRHVQHPTVSYRRIARLNVYSSASSTPLWTADLPSFLSDYDKTDVFVTPDGETIVTAVFNLSTFRLDLAFFRPDSPLPFKTLELDVGVNPYQFLLSEDGEHLYVAGATDSKLFELENGTRLATAYFQGQYYAGHAISGDGKVFAIGGSGNVRVFREQDDGTYRLAFTHDVPYDGYCNALGLSRDGSTLVAGFNVRDGFRTVVLRAVDVETGALLMSHAVVGNGQKQNMVTDVDVSADGSRFAAALTGDGAAVHELRVYDSTRSFPLRTKKLAGSALTVDLSADGSRVAAGCKAAHANDFASGGCIDYMTIDSRDLRVVGVPRAGGLVDIEVRGPAFANVVLFSSAEAADEPFLYPDLGLLYLRRAITMRSNLGTLGSSGFLRTQLDLSNRTAGETLHLQGFMGGSELTQDWVTLTVLP